MCILEGQHSHKIGKCPGTLMFYTTEALVELHLEDLLKDMKGFKFIETLEVTFEKEMIDSKTGKHVSIYKTASSMVELKPLLRLMI